MNCFHLYKNFKNSYQINKFGKPIKLRINISGGVLSPVYKLNIL